jgi:hypothetical protein
MKEGTDSKLGEQVANCPADKKITIAQILKG